MRGTINAISKTTSPATTNSSQTSSGVLIKARINATMSMKGAYSRSTTEYITATITYCTSVFSLTSRFPVRNWSKLAKEKVWILSYNRVRIAQAVPWAKNTA